jgi:hypothetical protein
MVMVKEEMKKKLIYFQKSSMKSMNTMENFQREQKKVQKN